MNKIDFDGNELADNACFEEENDKVLLLDDRKTLSRLGSGAVSQMSKTMSQMSKTGGFSSRNSKHSTIRSMNFGKKDSFHDIPLHSGMGQDDNVSNYNEDKQNFNDGYSPYVVDEKFNKTKRPSTTSSADLIVKVHNKPFKSEYDNEYGGGRLDNDPRQPESQKKWYVPNYEVIQSRGENSAISAISLMRKNNISFTNQISKKNFRRYKRFPHPFEDDKNDPEQPMIPYKTSYVNRPPTTDSALARPNSNCSKNGFQAGGFRPAYIEECDLIDTGNHNRNRGFSDQFRPTQKVLTMPIKNLADYDIRNPNRQATDPDEFNGNYQSQQRYNTEECDRIQPAQSYGQQYYTYVAGSEEMKQSDKVGAGQAGQKSVRILSRKFDANSPALFRN